MIARKVGPHLGLQRRREETGVLHRRERQQQASVPDEFDPQHGQSPRIHSSTVKRIGEPAVKTVLAITKKRVTRKAFSLCICSGLRRMRGAVIGQEVARYRVLDSFSRMSISQAAD